MAVARRSGFLIVQKVRDNDHYSRLCDEPRRAGGGLAYIPTLAFCNESREGRHPGAILRFSGPGTRHVEKRTLVEIRQRLFIG